MPSCVIGRCGRALRTMTYAAYVQAEQRNTQRNWYQKKKGKPQSTGSFFAYVFTSMRAMTGRASRTSGHGQQATVGRRRVVVASSAGWGVVRHEYLRVDVEDVGVVGRVGAASGGEGTPVSPLRACSARRVCRPVM